MYTHTMTYIHSGNHREPNHWDHSRFCTFRFSLNIHVFSKFLLLLLHLCVCSAASGRKGQRSFGSSVRCVWQTADSSLGQTLSLIQPQSVIGTWIWANNNNVILIASHHGYYNWHIISLYLVAFIIHFFIIFGNDSSAVGCWGRSWCVIQSHNIRSWWFVSDTLRNVPRKITFNANMWGHVFFGQQIPEQNPPSRFVYICFVYIQNQIERLCMDA